MGRLEPFFLSDWEIFQQEHPEKVRRKRSPKEPIVFDCSTCGLDKKCRSGRIERYGKGKKRILVVGLCPGQEEDRQGVPFVGPSGGFLKTIFEMVGVDLDEDCWRTNIISCYPGKDKEGRDKSPTDGQIKCCRTNLERDIEETKPTLIICFGGPSINEVLDPQTLRTLGSKKMHGKVIPCHKWGCWVGCSFHPSYILRNMHKKKTTGRDILGSEMIFAYDLIDILSKLDEPVPKPLTMEGNIFVMDSIDAVDILSEFSRQTSPVAFDYEATCLSSHDEKAKILTVSLSVKVEEAFCIHLDNPDWNLVEQAFVYQELKLFLQSDVPKVVQNYNMEELWSRNLVGASMNNMIWDTMVSKHVLGCRVGTTGLAFQVYEMTGHEYKKMVDVKDLENEPIEDVLDYNGLDARYTLMAYYWQKERIEKGMERFNGFFTKCLPVLANLKDRGIRIDKVLLEKCYSDYVLDTKNHLGKIQDNTGVRKFREEQGSDFNINSGKQLGEVLYGIYKVPSVRKTKTGEATDEGTLRTIMSWTKNKNVKELIGSILKYRKIFSLLKKVREYKEIMDPEGYVHPSYNLNIADTFRSTATNPNSQNIYKRDKELVKFRRFLIPRSGNLLLEVDYGGIEVRTMAMASGDKELIRQIVEDVDTHRKWAAGVYQKDPADISEEERYNGKNGFVFPSFYGAESVSIVMSFPGVELQHIEKIQRKFWEEYSGVKAWQNRVLDFYREKGYVEGLSGYRRPGPLSTFQIYNTPIQGTAFHLLLDALQRIDDEMMRRELKSYVMSEIHDSIVFDVDLEEVEEVVDLSTKILCSKRFDWQEDVPLSVSWEMGEDWYNMKII